MLLLLLLVFILQLLAIFVQLLANTLPHLVLGLIFLLYAFIRPLLLYANLVFFIYIFDLAFS